MSYFNDCLCRKRKTKILCVETEIIISWMTIMLVMFSNIIDKKKTRF